MNFFDDAFMELVRDDPLRALGNICEYKEQMINESRQQEWQPYEHEFMLGAYAVVVEMRKAALIEAPPPEFRITGDINADCMAMAAYLSLIKSKLADRQAQAQVAKLRSRVAQSLGTAFYYEFSQGDLERVQRLINEIRESIKVSELFDEDHRRRVLAKLEKLQGELHKKMSDLDRFWGMVAEAGVAFGKFGEGVKPLVDRINELASIAWQAQKRAEELPSNAPLPKIEHSPQQDEPGTD